ncbi:phosphatase PAP2 family protein [Candidatus Woesearchaeota archaeon]|nr:phosphatase PAP2 family protein [Candidatus Woesearchaeota archaeon]
MDFKIDFKNEIRFFYRALIGYFSFFGSFVFFVLAVILFFILNQKDFALKFAIGAVTSMAIEHLIKFFHPVRRPDSRSIKPRALYEAFQEKTSFPSGHSAIATVFTTLIYLEFRMFYLTALFVFISLMVGLSRISLKRHYLSDVITGYVLGVTIGLIL